jgi:sodium ion-translocating decarboxylase beta subunit
MEQLSLSTIFQTLQTIEISDPVVVAARLGFIILGLLLMYLGHKEILEPLLMIPMGLGMAAVNAGTLVLDPHTSAMIGSSNGLGNLFVAPLINSGTPQGLSNLVNVMQIDYLQPVYNFAFSNGLIACVVFMGIGVLLNLDYLLARPFESLFIAMFAELGTVVTYPLAIAMGLTPQEAASVATVGGADGPMVLFTSLMLAPHLLVPIAVVAYLYLGLTYGGYPFLIKLMVPKKIRQTPIKSTPAKPISSTTKLMVSGILCVVLCLLFPVAAPLFFSLFLGISIREAGIEPFKVLLSGPMLYAATLFLGLMLGVLCDATIILDPKVLILLVLGILALLFSGIGGIIGGYILYFFKKGNYNPVIGIAGVSCVPTTAKVAQKVVGKDAPGNIIMPYALGANISGVITSAIFTGLFVSLLR